MILSAPWRILIVVVLVLATGAALFVKGIEWQQGKDAIVEAAHIREAVELERRQHHETVKTEIRYVDRIKYVHDRLPAVDAAVDHFCDGVQRPGNERAGMPAGAGELPSADEAAAAAQFRVDLKADYQDAADDIEQCSALIEWCKGNGCAKPGG